MQNQKDSKRFSRKVIKIEPSGSFFFCSRIKHFLLWNMGIVAWKTRWASRLLASEANVKTIGGEKR